VAGLAVVEVSRLNLQLRWPLVLAKLSMPSWTRSARTGERLAVARQLKSPAPQRPDRGESHCAWIRRISFVRTSELCVIKLGPVLLVADDLSCTTSHRPSSVPSGRARRKCAGSSIEPLAETHGHKPVALLERRHVKQWRDARGKTPGMANMVVRVVRMLLNYAVDNEYRRDNPA
jgi:hypothetical protein